MEEPKEQTPTETAREMLKDNARKSGALVDELPARRKDLPTQPDSDAATGTE